MPYSVIAFTVNPVLVAAAGVARIRMSVPEISTSNVAKAVLVLTCAYSVATAVVPLCVLIFL